ncbi:MAG: dTMP kinase [Gemmatimonadaceae bacterium]
MAALGLLIVLEGVEGVGKTTQWERLADNLTSIGQTVLAVREPGGTDAGNAIRQIVLHSEFTLSGAGEALLFAASRAEIITHVIQPALLRGETVLLDRFLLSTYAYQGAGRGLDMNSLKSINAFATKGITPDVTMLLTLPLKEALARARQRSQFDRIERENHEFHARVADAFIGATNYDWQNSHPECGEIVEIDASGTADEVTQRCRSFLAQRWPSNFGALLDHSTRSSAVAAESVGQP